MQELQRRSDRSGLYIGTIVLITKRRLLNNNASQGQAGQFERVHKGSSRVNLSFHPLERMDASPNTVTKNIHQLTNLSNEYSYV